MLDFLNLFGLYYYLCYICGMEKEVYVPESYDPDKIDFSKIDWEYLKTRPISEESDCLYCIHRMSSDGICVAFPCGIPNEYFLGKKEHRVPDGKEADGIVCDFDYEL